MENQRLLRHLGSESKRYSALVKMLDGLKDGKYTPSELRNHASYILENMHQWDIEDRILGMYICYNVFGPDVMLNIASTLSRLLSEVVERYGTLNYEFIEYLFAVYIPVVKRNPKFFRSDIITLGKFLSYPVFNPESIDARDSVHISAIKAMKYIGAQMPEAVSFVIPVVVKVMTDTFLYQRWKMQGSGQGTLRRACWDFLYTVGVRHPQAVIPSLITMCTHRDRGASTFAETLIFKIGDMSPETTVSALISVLGSEMIGARLAASDKLHTIIEDNDGVGMEQLIWATESPNAYVREHSVQTIGAIARASPELCVKALAHLKKILVHDAIKDVRQQAADALYYLAENDPTILKNCIPELIKGMNDTYHHVRWRSVQMIGMLGAVDKSAIKDAVPLLMECTTDRHEHVRWRAQEAIDKIGLDKSKYMVAHNQMLIFQKNGKLTGEDAKIVSKLFHNMEYDRVISYIETLKNRYEASLHRQMEQEDKNENNRDNIQFNPRAGNSYIILSDRAPTTFYGTIKVLANMGWPVLLVTNMHPKKLHTKYNLMHPNIHIVFISSSSQRTMELDDFAGMKRNFFSFVNNSHGVIAIDILDSYINDNAGKIAEGLIDIDNMVVSKDAIMLISMMGNMMNLPAFATLIKRTDVVSHVPPFKWAVLRPVRVKKVRMCGNCLVFYNGEACPICGGG